MGLFNKKEKEETPTLPRLPELPKLPISREMPQKELPEIPSEKKELTIPEPPKEIHQLPSFPTNQMGEKFSQNTIKNAVSGDDNFSLNFPIEDIEMDYEMPIIDEKRISPKIKKRNFEENEEVPESKVIKQRILKAEPVFIRIDKFKESLEIFDNTKTKISEIEELLKETKELKQKEEKELSLWEQEISSIKTQIEKVDKDLFSKIE